MNKGIDATDLLKMELPPEPPHLMSVAEIVSKFLRDNDFDGLCKDVDSPDCCGCSRDCLFDRCEGKESEDCHPAFLANSFDDGDFWHNCKDRATFENELRAEYEAENAAEKKKCCQHCDDGDGDCFFPHYGVAPHAHYMDPDLPGDFVGTTKLFPKDQWPANFKEDPEAPGCGTYTFCPMCGQGRKVPE